MWRLIRAAFRRRRGQQQRVVNRCAQAYSCLNVAAQVCHNDLIVHNDAAWPNISAIGRQREANDPIYVAGHWRAIVKNEWGMRSVANWNYYGHFAGSRIGVVCHDGSYRVLEWDSKKGWFVPCLFMDNT
jgi:hypothetical protein